ncbi:MAG: hypothetical protein ABI972_14540 [Acidobacteriota bacterium]
MTPTNRVWALLCALVLVLLNFAIAAPLFGLEFSAYNGSIEHAFIANARLMAARPFDWNWWPYWGGGMPIEHSYLPLQQWIVAAVMSAGGYSAARAYHIVTATFYVAGPVALFAMALSLSRAIGPSFLAGLVYSCLSPGAFLVSDIAGEIEGLFHLRRFQTLVYYGEGPHTIALTLLPLAVICFHRALTAGGRRWAILAGLLTSAIALTNAFGLIALFIALLSLLLTFRYENWWRIAVIGIVSYCWISPWFTPTLIAAVRTNSPTSGGDYRFSASSYIVLAILAAGFAILHALLRRGNITPYLHFFALFAYVPTAITLAYYWGGVAVIAQPHRYQHEMELALVLLIAFAALRIPARFQTAFYCVVALAAAFQTIHVARYTYSLVRPADPTQLVEYKIAKWLDSNRPGERAFLSGSTSLLYNVFTDNPQFYGGHEPYVPNSFLAIPAFTIYSGANAGERDADYSIFWLKAYGARAISVSGPQGREVYKPFARPGKFEGRLPVLWREGDDTIYEVPSRSPSLAHIIPAAAVAVRTPIHGLDIAPVQAYVAALDDPRYPAATFQWQGTSEAVIQATVDADQVVHIQVTYHPGWEAYSNGARLRVRRDAIGLMVVEPNRVGPCHMTLRYTGGSERILTRVLSLSAMLAAGVLLARRTSGKIV